MAERDKAAARYARIEAEHPDHSYADDARLRTAELATDAGDDAQAAKLLAEIPTSAIRRATSSTRRCGAWPSAPGAPGTTTRRSSWLDENLRLIPHEEIWYAEGRAHYWKGRIFAKQDKPKLARESYERAIREYPLSVYALLSFARLRESAPKAVAPLVAGAAPRPGPSGEMVVHAARDLRRRRVPARRRAGAHGPGRRRAPRAGAPGPVDGRREARSQIERRG